MIDFFAAFDTIDHDALIHHLEHDFGIKGSLILTLLVVSAEYLLVVFSPIILISTVVFHRDQ